MAWPARTWVAGEVVTAALGNSYWRDPLTDVRGGGIGVASQAQYDTFYASSTTQLARLANGTSGQFYGANSSAAPSWKTVYPASVWASVANNGSASLTAGGNVTSVTRNNTGDVTVTFTSALANANYAAIAAVAGTVPTGKGISIVSKATGSVRVNTFDTNGGIVADLNFNIVCIGAYP